jgi:AcrR family transcriptional regulator
MPPKTPEQFEEIRTQKRAAIIAAALELFANKGYHSTSISSIAEQAGISKGLIYNYFDSKKSILLAIFDDAMQVGDEILARYKGLKDPYEIMRRMTEDTFDFLRIKKQYGQLLTAISLQPGVADELNEFIDIAFKKNTGIITALYKQIGHKDPYISGLMLSAVFDGVSLGYFMLGDSYPMDDIKKRIIEDYCTPPKKKKKK